jgi:hypothetical protein
MFEARTMKSLMLDTMIKYNGWAAMSSYMSRTTTKNAITIDPNDNTQSNFVYVGSGFDHQLSYIFPSNYEIIGRYSTQTVGTTSKLWHQIQNSTLLLLPSTFGTYL